MPTVPMPAAARNRTAEIEFFTTILLKSVFNIVTLWAQFQ
jgi:hypothetical protein